jgi:hypothetical protein
MPQEPLVPSPIPPSRIYNPTVQQRITDAGGQAELYGQTPAQQEAGRARQGGGAEAARMTAEEWAQRVTHDEIRRSAAYAASDLARRRTSGGGSGGGGGTGGWPWDDGTGVPLPPSAVMGLGPSWTPREPEQAASTPQPATSDSIGVGGGITVLIFTAIFCGVPWHAYLATNTGDALGHLFWVMWSLVAIPVAIFGVVAGLRAIFDS